MDIWLANKLRAKDSDTKLDEWKLTHIPGCECRRTWTSTLSDRTVVKDMNPIVLIPFAGFVEYELWKKDTSAGYTMSQGDFIFLTNPGEITRNNITQKCNELGSQAINIKTFDVASREHFCRIHFQIKVSG